MTIAPPGILATSNTGGGQQQPKPKSRFSFKARRPQQTAKCRELYMQNYLSVGVDALVTYNFHRARESSGWGFSGRLYNKLLYFIYGTKDVLERECQDLDRLLEVELDGERIELPNLESLVVLNIPSWGAGVRPWELGSGGDSDEFNPPRIDDGRLEVFAVYSSFHIAQMQVRRTSTLLNEDEDQSAYAITSFQVGLSEPHRLGQASTVTIRLSGRAPMQSDGEPWIQQGPAEIKVRHHKAVPVMEMTPIATDGEESS